MEKKKHANEYFTCLVLDNMYCLDGGAGPISVHDDKFQAS
jgi:hypothetical protein